MVQQSEDSVFIEYPSGDGSQGGEASTTKGHLKIGDRDGRQILYNRVKMMCSLNTLRGAGEDYLIGRY